MFVTFEGPEGAGKSSALASIASHLAESGHDVVATREPGSGETGRQIREILLHGDELSPRAELMLYLADRAEHVAKTIRPALDKGAIVLCDRFTDSTIAYQGYGRGFDVEELRALNEFVTDGLVPDLTILFDLEPSLGLSRLKNADRLDREPLAFHEKVRTGFLRESERDPNRWMKVDASRPLDEVVRACREAIERLIERAV